MQDLIYLCTDCCIGAFFAFYGINSALYAKQFSKRDFVIAHMAYAYFVFSTFRSILY